MKICLSKRFMRSFGRMLSERRKILNLTQADVANQAKCITQFVSNIERGVAFPPSHLMQKFVHIYDLDPAYVVKDILSDIKITLESCLLRNHMVKKSKIYCKQRIATKNGQSMPNAETHSWNLK